MPTYLKVKQFPRPRGAAPKGLTWSYETGQWVPVDQYKGDDENPPEWQRSAEASAEAAIPPATATPSAQPTDTAEAEAFPAPMDEEETTV